MIFLVLLLNLSFFRTKNNTNLPIAREESTEEFGEVNIRFNVGGYLKANAAVTLETAEGPLVISMEVLPNTATTE